MTSTCPNGHTSGADDFCDTCGAKIDPTQQAPGGSLSLGDPAGEGGEAAKPSEQTCPNCQTANAVDALFCEACGYDFTTGALPRGAAPLSPSAGVPAGEAGDPGAPEGETPDGEAAGGGAPGGTTPDGPWPQGGASEGEPPEGQTPDAGAPQPTGGEAAEARTPEGAESETAEHPQAEQSAPPVGAGGNISPKIPLEWVAEVWIDPDWYAGQEAEEPMPSPGLPSVVPLTNRSALIGRISTSRNIVPDIDCTSDTGVSRRHAQLSTDGKRWFVEDLGSSNGTFIGAAAGPLPEDPIPVGPRQELDGDDRVYVGAWTRIVVRSATDDERDAHAE